MKDHLPAAICILMAVTGFSAEPQRISIAPTNDLSALRVLPPAQGSIWISGGSVSKAKAYKTGYCLAMTNDIMGGHRNILVINDGRSHPAAIDRLTGFPIVILTDARPTAKLKTMVRGYNKAMRKAWIRQLRSNIRTPNKPLQTLPDRSGQGLHHSL